MSNKLTENFKEKQKFLADRHPKQIIFLEATLLLCCLTDSCNNVFLAEFESWFPN